ncbi:galactose mutarotase-like protein [Dichomitus squalens]|uniref:Galactose mutarotase-like protein n=1 Tax=Dichomitus squalens TaxID=114155 RepID=A0A4Q9MBM8_9APHY|nr:galactose mutarotase-like protein [Dichomitus squalens]
MRSLLSYVTFALLTWSATAQNTTTIVDSSTVAVSTTTAVSESSTLDASTTTGTSTFAVSSSSATNPLQTPGFVNNGTVGAYACAISDATAATNQIVLADNSTNDAITFGGTLTGTTLASCPEALQPTYPFNSINLRSPDDSIRATFLPYGASVSELWVKDRDGVFRDIVLGFDNKTNYGTDVVHPNFGPQVGRYANRIKNGTFTIDGKIYHTPLNENNHDTLHGGTVGYDRSAYQITNLTSSSVTFTLHDADGNQGFPGSVVSSATYILENTATWRIEMDSYVTDNKKSPIMLSSHTYWNLAAYNGSDTVLDHIVYMPRADKYIKTDQFLIPTGEIASVKDTPFDFQTPRPFSERFNETVGVCGATCQGWDSCFVMSKHKRDEPVFELTSPASGIKLSVTTDQVAIQVYTCDGISSAGKSLPRKRAHGGDGTTNPGKFYDNHSCVVVEMEDYIDGINNPHWGRNQIYDKHRPYHWRAEYKFSTVA